MSQRVRQALQYALQHRPKNSPWVFTNPRMVVKYPHGPNRWHCRFDGFGVLCGLCGRRIRTNRKAALIKSGRVAQLGEHRPYKPGVTGSSPVPPTNLNPISSDRYTFQPTLFLCPQCVPRSWELAVGDTSFGAHLFPQDHPDQTARWRHYLIRQQLFFCLMCRGKCPAGGPW